VKAVSIGKGCNHRWRVKAVSIGEGSIHRWRLYPSVKAVYPWIKAVLNVVPSLPLGGVSRSTRSRCVVDSAGCISAGCRSIGGM
jgi:hypothetical protein